MKERLPELLRKIQFPVLIASAVMPLLLLINCVTAPFNAWLSWLFAGLYVAAAIGSLFVPGKRRLLYGGLCVGAMLVLAWFLTNRLNCPHFMLAPVLLSVLLMLSLRFAGWGWAEEIPDFCYWVGFALHVAHQVLVFLGEGWYAYALLDTGGHSIAAFFIFIIMTLMSMSRSSMIIASMGRHKASAGMRRKGLRLVGIFFGVTMLIALLFSPAVRPVIAWAKTVIAWVQSILPKKDTGETYPTETTEPGLTEDNSNELLGSEPGPFFRWLQEFFLTIFDFVLMIAVPLVLIAVAVVAVFLLYKLMSYLLRRLNKYAEAAGEDYEDVITDTREEGQRESLGDRIRNSEIFVNESKLTPAQRIRLYYRRLMRKHPEWGRSTTARENLPDTVSGYYEQARYGGKSLTKTDADRFASGTKDL